MPTSTDSTASRTSSISAWPRWPRTTRWPSSSGVTSASSVFGPDVLTVLIATEPTTATDVVGPARPTPSHEDLTDEGRVLTLRPDGSWASRRGVLAERLAPWTANGAGPGDEV